MRRCSAGLGRGVAEDGRLAPEARALALANLERFVGLARGMGVSRLQAIATAATRDAADGPAFLAEVEARCGVRVRQLDGAEEARLSALGVVSAVPGAHGLMGDLGGGSLELVALADGSVGRVATLPLGPLSLGDTAGVGRAELRQRIDAELAAHDWLPRAEGAFYAVGGAWRALATLHMAQTDYPLNVIHNYRIPGSAARDVCRIVAGLGRASLRGIEGVPRRRRETLPLAALVLERVLRRTRPKAVVFSAFGLREGCLYDTLDEHDRAADPLLIACEAIAARAARFGAHGPELAQWTAPLFADEAPAARRLRLAACHLADIAWSDHPGARAAHAHERVLRLPLPALDHEERARLALAVMARYDGWPARRDDGLLRLLDDDALTGARVLGTALRAAETLSGGVPGVLPQTSLELGPERLALRLAAETAALDGEVVRRRFAALGRLLERETEVVAET